MRTTPGQLLINDVLPAQMQRNGYVLDKKGVTDLANTLADQHPEQYAGVMQKLLDIGRETAYQTGGNSFGINHLRAGQSTHLSRQASRGHMSRILADDSLTDEQKHASIMDAVQGEADKLNDNLYQESLAKNNPLGLQVLSGSRGTKSNLRSLRGFDAAYEGHDGSRLNLPILSNYAEGLTPAEYFAGTFGARKGVLDTKLSTGEGGYLAKHLVQVSHRLLVSQLDDEEDPDNKNLRGLPVAAQDRDNVGALLAVPHGPYGRNTVITPKILQHLQHLGHDELLIRSPTVGGPDDGGVFARDVGVREKNKLAPIGDYTGIAAAAALSEKLTQGALSSKHSGGVAGAGPRGMALVNQLLQTPEEYSGGATHAQLDGTLGEPYAAPQGGNFVRIGDKEHYVPPYRTLKVKPGDVVEAGDALTDGLPNPEDIVTHKGIGEGRKYFTNQLLEAFRDSGITAHRRNIELVARGLVDHVRINDIWNDHAPDDVIPYQSLERKWEPRVGTQIVTPRSGTNKYLEKPVLHYTIGTHIKPSVVKTLEKFNVPHIQVHAQPPPFTPEMQRAATAISHDPDWQTRLLGSGQKATLLKAVHRGDVSDTAGTSYVPALIEGKNFGLSGVTKGWDPEDDD